MSKPAESIWVPAVLDNELSEFEIFQWKVFAPVFSAQNGCKQSYSEYYIALVVEYWDHSLVVLAPIFADRGRI